MEVREKLAMTEDAGFEIRSLTDLGFSGDIPEPFDTLEENAFAKANHIHRKFNVDCFADDTGLEVDALGGGPGVYSARYAGEGCTFEDNVRKLLKEMQGVKERKARFRTVVCLIINEQTHYFEGRVEGRIIDRPVGSDGFGYDPIFIPDGYFMTFAQMPLEEKNRISHRARAVDKLMAYLSRR